jgi:hypothetical protein
LQQAATDRLAYDRVIAALGRYSLLTAIRDNLAVHRCPSGRPPDPLKARLPLTGRRVTDGTGRERHWAQPGSSRRPSQL